VPSAFDEETAVLDKPPGLTHDQCECLSVWQGRDQDGLPMVISCWKPTRAELDEIIRTGRVWLGIYGVTMPPAWVNGHHPFERPT